LAGMFSSPDFLAKLAINPSTRHLVSDKGFMAKLQMMQANPNNMMSFLQDPDMMKVRAASTSRGDSARKSDEGGKAKD
jgi:hypothetical protein